MISIHGEIQEIIEGEANELDNVLKNAPHPAHAVISDQWDHCYSREKAVYPLESLRAHKFWPSIGRIDNVHGDRNLVCTCESVSFYESK